MDINKLKGHIPDSVIAMLPDTMAKFELNTPLRLAHFLAQAGHESGGFKAVNENLNYGAKGLRDGLHTNTWVNALMADYKCVPADRAPNGWDCDNWIITDTRFPNEAQAIKDADGIIIRVTRPGIGPVNDHPSETGLNQWKFDYEIQNDGTLENLINSVKIFKQKFGI